MTCNIQSGCSISAYHNYTMQKFVYDIGPWSLQLLLLVVAVMVWSFLLLRIAPYRLIDMKQTHFPPFQKQHSRPKRNRQKWYYISTIIFLGGFWFCSSYLDLHKFYLFLALFITFESKIFFSTERLEKSCNKNSEKSLLVLLSSLLLPSLLLLLSSSLLLPSLLLAFSVTKC